MRDIAVSNVSKSYPATPVLENFSAVFKAGRATCLRGPSGAGKTTLTRLIMGLETPDAGAIDIAPKTRFAAVFQEDRLCEQLSAVGNVSLVLGKTANRADIERSLGELGLSGEALQKPASELSGGMRRRVCIARAAMAESDVVVLDEPFKGLDARARRQAIDYIKRKTAKKTMILVSHDARDAADFGADIVDIKPLQP